MAVVRIDLEVNNKGEASIAKVVGGLEGVGKAADKAKDKGSSFAKSLEKDLDGLGVKSGALASALGFLANPLTLVGAAAAGLAGMLASATSRLISTSSAIADLHGKTAIAQSSLQTFKYQGALLGVELGTITGAVTQMNKRLVESPQAFSKLGLSASALKNMRAEDALAAIAEKIKAIQNPAEQTAAAMQLFGRSGTEILGLLKSDLEGTADEARRFGIVLSDETIAAADGLDDSLAKLGMTWDALLMQTAAGISTNETLADTLDLVTKAIGALAGEAAAGKPKVSELVNELLKMTQAGKIVSILSALSERGPTVHNKPDLGGPSEINFDDILGRGMNLSADLFKSDEKAAAKAHAASEAAAKRHAAAVKSIEKAYRDAREEFEKMESMAGSSAFYGTGPMAGETWAPGLLGGKQIVGQYQAPGFQFPSSPTDVEMTNAIGRQNAIDSGYTYENVQKAKAAEVAAARQRERDQIEETAEALAVFVDSILGTIEMLIGLPDAFNAATDSSSRMQNALGGARVGGQAGAQVGQLAEMMGVPGGEAIGRVLGTVIGGIAGVFKTPSWIAVGKEAGNVLGIEVSEEMARAIEQRAKDLNISIESSSLLSLTDAIESSGKAASSFAPQFAQLMAGIANGSVPAKEGMLQLEEVFGKMVVEMESAGPAGQSFIDTMVEMAQATGTMTQSMKDFLKATAAAGANQLGDVFANAAEGAGMTAERMRDLGIIANAVLKRMKDGGATMAEIFDALGPALDAAIEAASKSGIALEGPFAILAAQRAFFQSLPESLQAAVDGFELLARAAGRSPEALAAVSAEAGRLYEQMYEAAKATGATDEAARLLAITPLAPTLSYLNQLAKEGKIVLDAETQALVDQADAAGLLDTTPQEKMLEIANLQLLAISALVTAFGATLPAAVQAYIDSLNNIPNVPPPPGGATGGDDGPGSSPGGNVPGLAAGDILMPKAGGHLRRLAEAGQPELAAPVKAFSQKLTADMAAAMAAQGQRGAAGVGAVRIDIDRRTIADVTTANLRRNIGGARNQQERIARGQRA